MEFSQPPGPDVTPGGPRIINVGVPGPGGNVPLWRRSWRDKVLPKPNPDSKDSHRLSMAGLYDALHSHKADPTIIMQCSTKVQGLLY